MFFLKHIKNDLLKITRITNSHCKTFKAGDTCTIVKKITDEDVGNFCKISGDTNPVHTVKSNSGSVIAHGAFLNSLVSGIIGTKLPGPGTLVVSQNLNFPNKCFSGEVVKITVKLIEDRKIIKVDFVCEVEDQKKVVMYGNAKLVLNHIIAM